MSSIHRHAGEHTIRESWAASDNCFRNCSGSQGGCLTPDGTRARIDLLMPSALRRHTRRVTLGLILTLAVMVSVECVSAKDTTQAQMACCAAMSHDCGAMAQKQSCCGSTASRVVQGAAVPRVSLMAPDATPVELKTPPPASFHDQSRPVAFFIDVATNPPGVPTYLLISTFRI